MSDFDNATEFFHTCESARGWDACREFVEPSAPFAAQSEPLVDFNTIEEYVNWMTAFCDNIAPGSSYVLHSSSFDEGRVRSMQKVWNAPWAMRELGWA